MHTQVSAQSTKYELGSKRQMSLIRLTKTMSNEMGPECGAVKARRSIDK